MHVEGEDDQRPPRGVQYRKKGTGRAGNHGQKYEVLQQTERNGSDLSVEALRDT